ncbi:hypothetical protein [Arthrobacter sp. YN]|uniref:hypothetical protein n=1 Tax=Arthrobacter sp. YN TaxID=2020486 RepID=UPI000B5FC13F|nr:hypothetical protein [Arthrobacter sp. YN]ASN20680.1 hypothetical protein CGK93_14075 [Arthrobacter sp. YN]
MTPEEVAESMLKRGSTEVTEFKDLKVGSRVRRSAEQWGEAYTKGTGTIERIFHKQNSSWERKYGRPDVELIVKRDDGEYSYLADYHVDLAEVQS